MTDSSRGLDSDSPRGLGSPNPLPPGPELDRLVAEKVMGWKYEEQSRGVYGFRDSIGRFSVNTPDMNRWDNYWSPSTSIADAKEVMDHFEPYLWEIAGRDMEGKWHAQVTLTTGCYKAVGETLPHAVSLAALSATTKGADH